MKHSLATTRRPSDIPKAMPDNGRGLRRVHGFIFRIVVLGGLLVIVVAAIVAGSAANSHTSGTTVRTNSADKPSSTQPVSSNAQLNQEATPMNNISPNTSTPSHDQQNAQSRSVSSSVSSTTINGQTSTSVTVNGQNVPVPSNGELHRTIAGPNGTTRVDVSNQSSGQQSESSSSSSSVQIDVQSSSAP